MSALTKARFAQIVLPRLDEGYRLARWLTGNPTDAEDVVQEACFRAFRSIDSFTEGNARSWFLTIVRNTAYSWMQRHRPSKLTSIEDLALDARHEMEIGGTLSESVETPEDALIAKNQAGELQRAIEELPVHLRETLVLREYHELSYREIAALQSVPVGTVMSRLAKARHSLLSRAWEGRS